MSKKAIIALCIAVILPVVCYLIANEASKNAIRMPARYYFDDTSDTVINGKKESDTIWHSIENATFTNQLGDKISIQDLRGKLIVANFFFTRCPSICPTLTRNMKDLVDAMKGKDLTKLVDTPFVQFLSFSVDPERDSVPALKKYADHYGVNHDSWWLLTAPKKTIYDYALNELKLGVQDGEGIDSNFIHTEKFVVIDRKGIVRGYYRGLDTASLSKLAEDLTLLMLEKNKGEKSAVFQQIKDLWPIFVAVIICVVALVWVLRKPRIQPKN